MAIDIRHLRIGSHVECEGRRVRVCGITKRKVGYHATGKPCEHLSYARIEGVRPIPITSSLLTELGFEDCSNEFCAQTVYCRKIRDKEVAFSPVDGDCWKCGVLYGGFDIGYCLCCGLNQAEAFLALYNIELLND